MRESERLRLKRLMDMGKPNEEILEAMKPNRRKNGHKVPEGGICLREAARKYHIPASTLSDWLRNGKVELIEKCGKFKYLKESEVERLSKLERRIGVRTIEK